MATFKATKTFYRAPDGQVMVEGDPAFDHGHMLVREGMEIEETELAIFPDHAELLKQMKALNSASKAQAAEADKAIEEPPADKAIEGPPANKSAGRRS